MNCHVPKFDEAARLRVAQSIQVLPLSKAWEVTIEEKKPRRSEQQNRLLWSLYTEIIQKGGEAMQGWTKDDLHEFFLCNHFGTETIDIFGKKRQVPMQRSSKLNKQDFSDLVESIVRFMAERGIILKLPGEIHA